MAEDIQRKAINIISEIAEKAADGNYIYRGEPEWHTQVSSSLWRQFQSGFTVLDRAFTAPDRTKVDYEAIQESSLREARRYERDVHQDDDFALASELQHVGGNTNLIDFTECYLVALFFACDGAHDKPGRVILLKQTEQIRNKYQIKKPHHPPKRVVAQKSVFVRHKSGIIEEGDIEEIICIRPSFKQPILTYLREKHCIYTQKIYNDLQGYIKHQEIHHDAYSEYRRGHRAGVYCRVGIKQFDGIDFADVAIKCLSEAIKLNPFFVEAYFERAHVYWGINDLDKAIKDFTRVIDLNRDHAFTHVQRGKVYSEKGCSDRAKEDFKRAKELGDPDAHDLLVEELREGSENIR